MALSQWKLIRLRSLVSLGKHGRGKGKGKSTKGKNQQDGKQGKGKGNDKGSHDGKGKKIDSNQCSYCVKFGHWRRDCNKLKEDRKHNRVRQIEEVDTGSQSSNATTATGSTPSTVRLVSISPVIQEHPIDHDDSCEDLTLHYTNSEQVARRCIRVLSMGVLKPKFPDACSGQNLSTFDLTYSDDNEDCTLCNSPTWSLSSSDDNLPQVRVMVDASTPVYMNIQQELQR